MFNRALQVRFVKNHKNEAEKAIETEEHFEDKAFTIAVVTNSVIRKIAMAALAYVVVDTGRQVLVARATNQ